MKRGYRSIQQPSILGYLWALPLAKPTRPTLSAWLTAFLALTVLRPGPPDIGLQFRRFAAVGVIGTLGHYAVLVALVHLQAVNPVLASSIGAVVGALLNYSLNYRFTFNSSAAHRVAFPRFLSVTLLGFIINLLIMWFIVDVFGLHYLFGQGLATIVVLLWNFGANRFWTFGNDA